MQSAPVPKPHPLPTGAFLWGTVLLLTGLCLAAPGLQAQPVAPAAVAAAARPAASAASAAAAARAVSHPTWNELTPAQREALQPLAGNWHSLSEGHKRKWIALSRNYPTLPPAEQAKLHSRMTEWSALSPQQRSQARLNFAEAKQLSPAEKKAKWEAYQALSEDEKKRLAAGAAPKPAGAAIAVKPASAPKLAVVPGTRASHTPKIAASPHQVDHNTLLPQPQPEAVSAPPAPSH